MVKNPTFFTKATYVRAPRAYAAVSPTVHSHASCHNMYATAF